MDEILTLLNRLAGWGGGHKEQRKIYWTVQGCDTLKFYL